MEDDFETRNMNRAQVARELEAAREKYRAQLRSVQQLRDEAPTEPLADRYRELEAELVDSIRKLDDLLGENRQQHPEPPPEASEPPAVAPPPPPPPAAQIPPVQYHGAATPASRTSEDFRGNQVESDRGRLLAILAGGALALILLGVLVWYFAFRTPAATIQEQPDPVVTAPAPESAQLLTITPATHDFGVVRKGTRAVRQFRLSNETDEPMEVSVERSVCRCLWYDFESTIPPKEATVLAVTFDGSRAPGGVTREELTISAGPDPSRQVTATIIATVE
jgi:hypothetical protein